MAFKLSKSDIARRDELTEAVRNARSELDDEINAYNEKLGELKAEVETALNAYNEKLADLKSWAEDIASEADSEWNDKSERWQEGDKGEAARTWIDEWQGFSAEDIEIEWPEDVSIDTMDDAADDVEQLPEEAE
jgi:hypothetical protein